MIDLPPIISLKDFSSIDSLIREAYRIFVHDFLKYPPKLANCIVMTRDQVMDNGYNASFWHIITEGDHLETSKVIRDRAERIPWINPIIDGQPDSEWLMWYKPGLRKNQRILIYSTKYKYLVVIEKRQGSDFTFITGYPIGIDNNHQERKLIKEYNAYKNAKGLN